MIINFIKVNHKTYRLECIINDEILYQKDLESRSMLRHDLMHYLIEHHANLKESFFGTIKYRIPTNEEEILQTEKIVAILQNTNKIPNFLAESIFENIRNSYNLQHIVLPQYINKSFITKVCKEYFFNIKKWEEMTTGLNSKIEMSF